MPARIISLWLAISASAGTSLTVARWNWLRRMCGESGVKGAIIAVRAGSSRVYAALRFGLPLGAAILRVGGLGGVQLLLALVRVQHLLLAAVLHHHRGAALQR